MKTRPVRPIGGKSGRLDLTADPIGKKERCGLKDSINDPDPRQPH